MPSKLLKENLVIIAVLSLFLCIIFYDVIFLGKTFKVTTGNPQALNTGPYGQEDNKLRYFPVQSTDSSNVEEPIQEFIKKCLWQGFLPLWNPHQGCGYPLIGMMQVGLFFPLNYILYLLPQLYAWDLMILSRIFFAGLFTYWLMRTFKFGKIPSLGAAIVYAFNGPLIVLHGWYANVDILTPLLLLSVERLIRKANLANYCCATAAITLTLLAGHAEHILLIHVLGFAFFCFRLSTIKPHAKKIKTISYLFFSYLLSAGIASIILLPFLHNWVTEFWHTHPANMGLLNECVGKAFRMFITLIIPNFFQKEPVLSNLTRTEVSWWGYIGIIAFMLSFCSLFSRQKQKLNYFFAVTAFVIFSKTYLNIPFINWIGYLPLLKHCRFYLHTPFLFSFTVAILSGM